MAVDIGTQIVMVIIFGFMAFLTKKNFPEISKYFGWAILTLVALFGVLDIIDAIGLIHF